MVVRYPLHGKGTGVLVDFKGFPCVVTGTHLVPNLAAAHKAFALFSLGGTQQPVRVRDKAQKGG